MRERELQDLLISILRAELTESEVPREVKSKLDAETISALYRLSKAHDLAHIVADALEKLGLLENDEISEKYRKQAMLSVLRCERIKYELGEICAALDKANIPYIPLKGSVIRDYYPKDSMRTSCDIDVLVREEKLNDAIFALKNAGYSGGETKAYHDVSLYSPSGVHLELHFNILEDTECIDRVLRRAWEYSMQTEGNRYAFTEEFFAYHIMAHMSYHFLGGGCGIRPLMDWYIIKKKTGISVENIKELLKEASIYEFAVAIDALAEVWFGGKAHTALTQDMQDYIMGAGVYGTLENRIVMKRRNEKSKFKYIMERLFPPYRKMIIRYPKLKRLPILLPIYYIIRMFAVIVKGDTAEKVNEAKINSDVSDVRIQAAASLTERLGLNN